MQVQVQAQVQVHAMPKGGVPHVARAPPAHWFWQHAPKQHDPLSVPQ
eukprot:CAMPEP_0179001682 /NCGR_PEP_ID=MMETSP0795-20121207/11514_1 /TAXON_ID=88552 /ORGANISM="Amoebophrya sp., Strain Ameob2" /LENGTH=46 /DNA_ID= /DNA_START= /DNA_END= /DNA_ORIENTATION=